MVGLLALLLAAPGAAEVRAIYHRDEAARLVTLLCEAIRFPTVKGNLEARAAQQAWLRRVASGLWASRYATRAS